MFKYLILLGVFGAGSAAQADSEVASITYASCAMCHAESGTDNAIPAIIGMPLDDLRASMTALAAAPGQTTIMHRFMVAFSPAEIDGLARHVSALKADGQ